MYIYMYMYVSILLWWVRACPGVDAGLRCLQCISSGEAAVLYQGAVSLTFSELFKIISRKYAMPKINIYIENFKLKLCTCAQNMAVGTRTKFQLEILIRSMIFAIHKFGDNILESLRNVSETTTRPSMCIHTLSTAFYEFNYVCVIVNMVVILNS